MPDENQKSQSGKSTSDRQNQVEIDDGVDIDTDLDRDEEDMEDEDRGVVSERERPELPPEIESGVGGRITRDDGDNDDEGELK